MNGSIINGCFVFYIYTMRGKVIVTDSSFGVSFKNDTSSLSLVVKVYEVRKQCKTKLWGRDNLGRNDLLLIA